MQKIMFNDHYGLTESVLEGRKMMTRRFCKDKDTNEPIFADDVLEPFIYYDGFGNIGSITFIMKDGTERISVPKYRVGEIVAIAQSYQHIYMKEPHERLTEDFSVMFLQQAGLNRTKGWNNKMFVKASLMPHHIKITDIKAERLQDICDEDCLREGIIDCGVGARHYGFADAQHWQYYFSPREAFAALIDKVGKKGTWERNPYVFAYSFEVVD